MDNSHWDILRGYYQKTRSSPLIMDASAPNSALHQGSALPSHLEPPRLPRYGTPEAARDSLLPEAGPPSGVYVEPLLGPPLGLSKEEGFAIDGPAPFQALLLWL